jgi:RNA polymerase sigma factor (sigma-70 family)
MTQTLPRTDGPGDAELISAVRGGDLDAYGDLFARHVGAARSLARQLVSPIDADDLVSDAFAKVLGVLQRGGGPDLAFRAYLLTAVRRLHIDKIRAGAKVQTTDDMEKFDPGIPFKDTVVEGFENATAATAFASLPERWQMVLWHTEVEGLKPAEVGELLGMSANSVSALAYRAREGLRQAYLTSHAPEHDDATCRWTHNHLGAYVRNGVSRRDAVKIEEHLDECRSCLALYLELTEVNSNLGAILGPLVLGGAAAGYVTSLNTGAAAAAPTGIGAVLTGLQSQFGVAVAGAAAATVAVGAITAGVLVSTDDPPTVAASGVPPAAGAPSVAGDLNQAPDARLVAPAQPNTEPPAMPTAKPAPIQPADPAPQTDATDSGGTDAPGGSTDQGTDNNGGANNQGSNNDGHGSTDGGSNNGGSDNGGSNNNGSTDTDTDTDGSTGPDPDSGGGTPPPPPPAPSSDLTLKAWSKTPGNNDGKWHLFVKVDGVAPDGTAVLRIDGGSRIRFASLDPACTPVDLGATCTISSSRLFDFPIDRFKGGTMTIDITVLPGEGSTDTDPNNNYRRVRLVQEI